MDQFLARQIEVTDAIFEAIHEQADRILRGSMDIATATGMRITDVRTIRMPTDGTLRFGAGKTKKWAKFQVDESPILTGLVQRRLAMKAHSVMLLTTNTGRQVSERMLTDRWDDAEHCADYQECYFSTFGT